MRRLVSDTGGDLFSVATFLSDFGYIYFLNALIHLVDYLALPLGEVFSQEWPSKRLKAWMGALACPRGYV